MENQFKTEDLKIELRTLTKDDYLGSKKFLNESSCTPTNFYWYTKIDLVRRPKK